MRRAELDMADTADLISSLKWSVTHGSYPFYRTELVDLANLILDEEYKLQQMELPNGNS